MKMQNLARGASLAALWLAMAAFAGAQDTPPREQQATPEEGASGADDAVPTMLPHFETDRLWLSGQANIVTQWHARFHSPYEGPRSLSAAGQDASSRVLTLYTGLRLTSTTEFLCDVQETGGHGLGEALGVAGFTNLDVVRNPSLSKAPYIARLMWHQIIPLTRKMGANSRSAFSGFSELPVRRLEIRFGKMSVADFFDLNSYGTDTNLQFMNWTVDNNGAYDYAADTRGFTFAAMVEYHERWWSVRFAEALMPKVANGVHLDADLSRARAENIEAELHGKIVGHQEGIVRVLAYVNHANMGGYRQAVADFEAGRTAAPDITAHPPATRVKYGFGVNFEQALNGWLGVFGRWGWNEGQHESYAYTEVDSTAELGAAASGKAWRRKFDRAGIAFVSNGIAKDHQHYLAMGGLGFLLGDGRLTYGRENIFEAYYTAHLWRGLYPALGIQHVNNPGYNRDRGPVVVPTARLHVEF
jgi:high affinity Mn2+ porin